MQSRVNLVEGVCIVNSFQVLADNGKVVGNGHHTTGELRQIVLHELVHGIAYKTLTGEKLTFGISWSCAYCGVPNIYTYRKTAIISVMAPLVVFSVLFVIALAILYSISPLYYLAVAFVFGMHLGGCSGDIYVLYLLLTKFKNKKTLMRDTGPEQFFYIPEEN